MAVFFEANNSKNKNDKEEEDEDYDDCDDEEDFFDVPSEEVRNSTNGCAVALPSESQEEEEKNEQKEEKVDGAHVVDNQPAQEAENLHISTTNTTANNRLEKNISKAQNAKERGNEYFRCKQFDESIQEYSQAIAYCPDDEENKANLAIFLGNRAAAYFAVEEFDLAVEDCNLSLQLNADYIKVLIRRSQALEKLSKPDEALGDAKRVKELDPSYPRINETILRLEKASEEKMNKLKDEALGKLKDLGNSILGNWGMSLDNFKMAQDPNTGSWSISMNK